MKLLIDATIYVEGKGEHCSTRCQFFEPPPMFEGYVQCGAYPRDTQNAPDMDAGTICGESETDGGYHWVRLECCKRDAARKLEEHRELKRLRGGTGVHPTIKMNQKWNPRFVCYAKFKGKSPEEMAELERGRMYKFMQWNQEKRHKFFLLYPNSCVDHNGAQAYDAWLEIQVSQ